MRRTKRRSGRPLRALAALLCVVMLLTVNAAPAAAKVSQADIDALKTDAGDLSKKKKELEAKLSDLKDDKAQALERKSLLDQQVENTAASIRNVEAQISDYDQLISQKETELADAQEREEAQYDLFCTRVRAMEKRGTVSYWSVLFKADSFTDLLGRLEFINEIMSSDQRVIDDLQALQVEIEGKKTELEDSRTESQAARAELVSQKAALDAQRKEAIALVNEIEGNQSEYQATLAELDREEEAIQARIVKLSKELAAQQAANGKPAQSNPGGYIWPVDSRYITSTVGGRASPGGVGSTNHKGTDIGRVGYTSSVYAAKAGTVIVSQYSSSYGNYVVVSHGSGNTTLYAHMSSRKVSVGQYVNQGAVLGITGSTGHSTGPHLHFEVTENGVRVNPLSHGAKPCKGYLSGYTLSGSA